MSWQVEYTDEYEEWWATLDDETQVEIAAVLLMLEDLGPQLKRPQADTLKGSKIPNLRELRVQCKGDPYRILYAFDPRRVAVLLLGGNKKGDSRFYKVMIPAAEKLYESHIEFLKLKGQR